METKKAKDLPHLENLKSNDGPRAPNALHAHGAKQRFEPGLIPLDDGGRAKKPQDARRRQKRAEHDRDPAVLVHVADGLAARSGAIDVGGVVRVEDGKGRGWEALGRDVDVFSRQWRRGCEEYLLFQGLRGGAGLGWGMVSDR